MFSRLPTRDPRALKEWRIRKLDAQIYAAATSEERAGLEAERDAALADLRQIEGQAIVQQDQRTPPILVGPLPSQQPDPDDPPAQAMAMAVPVPSAAMAVSRLAGFRERLATAQAREAQAQADLERVQAARRSLGLDDDTPFLR